MVSSRFCCCPKSPCYGPFVSCVQLLVILPPSSSRSCPLAPYCYPPLALLPHRSSHLSSVTPCPGIALPPRLLSNPLDRSNNLRDRATCYCRPTVPVFSPVRDHLPTPPGPHFRSSNRRFLFFWEPSRSVWVFLPLCFFVLFPYVSGLYHLRC